MTHARAASVLRRVTMELYVLRRVGSSTLLHCANLYPRGRTQTHPMRRCRCVHGVNSPPQKRPHFSISSQFILYQHSQGDTTTRRLWTSPSSLTTVPTASSTRSQWEIGRPARLLLNFFRNSTPICFHVSRLHITSPRHRLCFGPCSHNSVRPWDHLHTLSLLILRLSHASRPRLIAR